MAKREKLKTDIYSLTTPQIEFIPSGCTVLDCALGGGWALGRIANLVGDKSTAKTALATEAVINFLKKFPNGTAFYRETEAAFDRNYAQSMGLPLDKVDFGNEDEPIVTIEDFMREVDEFVERVKKSKEPGIYILDSLDALSDEAEMKAEGQAGFGMQKAKLLSIFFRKTARKLEQSQILLLVVSQVRENINAMAFGEKYRRSGGKGLDFYSSQIAWLAHIETLKRTINKVTRSYGITVRAKIKKNKTGKPNHTVDFPFVYNYGVEDLVATSEYLKDVNRLTDLSDDPDYIKKIPGLTDEEYWAEHKKAVDVVKRVWGEVEQKFAPVRKKYNEEPKG